MPGLKSIQSMRYPFMAGAAGSRNRDGQRYSDWVLMYIQAKKSRRQPGEVCAGKGLSLVCLQCSSTLGAMVGLQG